MGWSKKGLLGASLMDPVNASFYMVGYMVAYMVATLWLMRDSCGVARRCRVERGSR